MHSTLEGVHCYGYTELIVLHLLFFRLDKIAFYMFIRIKEN